MRPLPVPRPDHQVVACPWCGRGPSLPCHLPSDPWTRSCRCGSLQVRSCGGVTTWEWSSSLPGSGRAGAPTEVSLRIRFPGVPSLSDWPPVEAAVVRGGNPRTWSPVPREDVEGIVEGAVRLGTVQAVLGS